MAQASSKSLALGGSIGRTLFRPLAVGWRLAERTESGHLVVSGT